eukprot:8971585-Karenia_brevis.AAC.1
MGRKRSYSEMHDFVEHLSERGGVWSPCDQLQRSQLDESLDHLQQRFNQLVRARPPMPPPRDQLQPCQRAALARLWLRFGRMLRSDLPLEAQQRYDQLQQRFDDVMHRHHQA